MLVAGTCFEINIIIIIRTRGVRKEGRKEVDGTESHQKTKKKEGRKEDDRNRKEEEKKEVRCNGNIQHDTHNNIHMT